MNDLRSCTRVNTRNISTAFVYEYPTINALGEFIANLVSPKEMAQTIRSEVEQMLTLVGKYSSDFPEHTSSTVLSKRRRGGDVILITGSTGSIGASTLAELLESPKVEKVYALNRPHRKGIPLTTRQKFAFTSQGLKGDLVYSEKLVMLEGNLGRPCLGLEESIQQKVCNGFRHHGPRLHANPDVFLYRCEIRSRTSCISVRRVAYPLLSRSRLAKCLSSFARSLEGGLQPDSTLLRNLYRGPSSVDRLRLKLPTA